MHYDVTRQSLCRGLSNKKHKYTTLFQDDFFFVEGLQREKIESLTKSESLSKSESLTKSGSLTTTGARDSLWSQGIQLEVADCLAESQCSVSRPGKNACKIWIENIKIIGI